MLLQVKRHEGFKAEQVECFRGRGVKVVPEDSLVYATPALRSRLVL